MRLGQPFHLTEEYKEFIFKGRLEPITHWREKKQSCWLTAALSALDEFLHPEEKSDIRCSKWWCKGTELMCRMKSWSVRKRAGSIRLNLVCDGVDGMKTGGSWRRSWRKMISRWKEHQTEGEYNFQREGEEGRVAGHSWTTASVVDESY